MIADDRMCMDVCVYMYVLHVKSGSLSVLFPSFLRRFRSQRLLLRRLRRRRRRSRSLSHQFFPVCLVWLFI